MDNMDIPSKQKTNNKLQLNDDITMAESHDNHAVSQEQFSDYANYINIDSNVDKHKPCAENSNNDQYNQYNRNHIEIDNKNDNSIEMENKIDVDINIENGNKYFLQELRRRENAILSSNNTRNVYSSKKNYKDILDNIKSTRMIPYLNSKKNKKKNQSKEK